MAERETLTNHGPRVTSHTARTKRGYADLHEHLEELKGAQRRRIEEGRERAYLSRELEKLAALARTGIAVLFSSHDPDHAFLCARRALS